MLVNFGGKVALLHTLILHCGTIISLTTRMSYKCLSVEASCTWFIFI